MFARLKRLFRRPAPPRAQTLPKRVRAALSGTTHELFGQRISASWDSAKTTDDNSRHWANADTLSAAAAGSPSIRATLRSRARYEAQENNSYAKGIVLTLANDLVGTGPRLQMLSGNDGIDKAIEQSFARWAKHVRLAEKLRTMRQAQVVDGETFGLLVTNPRLPGRVQLDLRLIEADQVATPAAAYNAQQANAIDGIEIDDAGNPTAYHVLKNHPGDLQVLFSLSYDTVPASQVIHLFRADRAGQQRGISEIAPALPLFAQLRRFTLAVIAAAETAADFAGVMYTDAPGNDAPEDVSALDAIELERRSMLTLPAGWKMGQVDAKQPTTTYDMFKNEILNEIARCLNMPFNVAAGNSSSYNYSSGRLDHQTYFRAIDVDRALYECNCLDRLLSAWFDEALLAGELPPGVGTFEELPHRWVWPGREHVDPAKEANAAVTLWQAGLLTDDQYLIERGVDPEEHYEQLRIQLARRAEIGAPQPGRPEAGGGRPEEEDDDDAETRGRGDAEKAAA